MILSEQETRDYNGENPRAKMPYRMVVAHISNTGWVDIFISEIDTRGDGAGDSMRHVSLPAYEMSLLTDAWLRHPATIARQK
jgi:hypothetical protein